MGRILLIRGHKVILDADLAELYGVETKALTRAVRRNPERFPGDFMLQLSSEEFANLRRQYGTSSQWGGRRTPVRLHRTGHSHALQRAQEQTSNVR